MNRNPHYGAIAICSQGFVGRITSKTQMPVTYSDGSTGFAWTGVHLQYRSQPITAILPGDPWSSRNPVVLVDAKGVASLPRAMLNHGWCNQSATTDNHG